MVKPADFRTPGQYIQALLEERGWSQRVLAIVLAMDETGINKIVKGKRPVDAALALSLGELFDVAPDEFLALQQSFDLAQAKLVARPDPGRAVRARLFGDLPVAEMIKRGWISADSVRDVAQVEAALARFFGVATVAEIEILPHAAKRTEVSVSATPTQLAWLYRCKEIAGEMLTAQYTPDAVRAAIGRLAPLRIAPEQTRHVPRILAECGIRFVIVESLPSAKIDGVCFWLDDARPVIGMSLRHDRIDNFWFVLRHELEHVLRLHGRGAAMLDTELEGERAGLGDSVTEEERLANDAAAEFCVPRRSLDQLIARKAPFFAERDVLGFARTVGVHPGLVAGQLQHRTGRYDRFRSHQVKVRSCITPSAMVDGWGDVAPVGE